MVRSTQTVNINYIITIIGLGSKVFKDTKIQLQSKPPENDFLFRQASFC